MRGREIKTANPLFHPIVEDREIVFRERCHRMPLLILHGDIQHHET
jgi:hypothetical protein